MSQIQSQIKKHHLGLIMYLLLVLNTQVYHKKTNSQPGVTEKKN